MTKRRVLSALLALSIAVGGVATVNADTQDEIDNLAYEQYVAEAGLSEITNSIDSLESEKEVLLGQLDSVNQDLVLAIVSIQTLDGEIEAKNAELEITSANLAVAEEKKAVEYEAMKKRIQYLYENGGNAGWATFLLEEADITELLNQAEYTQKMYDYDRQCLEEYANTVTEVTNLQNQQRLEQAELMEMRNAMALEEQRLESIKADLEASNVNYELAIAQANEIAAEYVGIINTQNEQMQMLRERKAAEEAAAAAEAARIAAEAAAQAAAAQAAEEARIAAEAAAQAAAQQDYEAALIAQQQAQEAALKAQQMAQQQTTSGGDSSYTPDYSSSQQAPTGNSALGQQIVNTALQYVGYPYVYGGNSLTGGIDCSGFTKQIYAMYGISLPRSSAAQQSVGYAVSYAEAQPGDLICYSGHVAIYMGGGAIVHASNEINGICIFQDATYRSIVTVRRVV